MNFLAHALLAGPDPGVLTGSLIADFVKGPSLDRFPTAVQRGIVLHRRVDAYTDRHPVVLESVGRIRGYVRHYSGVVVDVLYDHFLARDFERHAGLPLAEFVDGVEQGFLLIKREMPELVKPRWSTTRWLAGYAAIEGLEQAFTRLSQRAKGRLEPATALEAMAAHDAALDDDFNRFFPDLQRFAATELVSLPVMPAVD